MSGKGPEREAPRSVDDRRIPRAPGYNFRSSFRALPVVTGERGRT